MAKGIDTVNSQNDVLTSMSHVMYAFEQLVQTEMPNIAVVYDEELSYETAIKKIFEKDNYYQGSTDPLPFFAYNRTILKEVDDKGLGKRAKTNTGCFNNGDGELLTYGIAYGEIDLNFLFVTKSMEIHEKFEVVYTSEDGITGTKEIIVDMPTVGEFKYYLDYQELLEKEIKSEDTYYKGIIGSIKARGFYFTFRGSGKAIHSINQRILATRNLPVQSNLDETEELGNILIE